MVVLQLALVRRRSSPCISGTCTGTTLVAARYEGHFRVRSGRRNGRWGSPPLTQLGHHLPTRGEPPSFPMISTRNDISWIWSKGAPSTNIVASLYRLAVVPFYLAQQRSRNAACLTIVFLRITICPSRSKWTFHCRYDWKSYQWSPADRCSGLQSWPPDHPSLTGVH